MARKRDVPSEIVTWFNEAPLDTAATVLAICRSIVAKRQPAKVKRQRPVVDVSLAPK